MHTKQFTWCCCERQNILENRLNEPLSSVQWYFVSYYVTYYVTQTLMKKLIELLGDGKCEMVKIKWKFISLPNRATEIEVEFQTKIK